MTDRFAWLILVTFGLLCLNNHLQGCRIDMLSERVVVLEDQDDK